MCWGLTVFEGEKQVATMHTVADVVAFFGHRNLRFSDDHTRRVNRQAEHCLCPYDTKHLVEAEGYRFIPHGDPRWDACDHAIERIPQ